MDMHEKELRRAKIMLSQAVRTVKDELSGKPPEPKKEGLNNAEQATLKRLLEKQ